MRYLLDTNTCIDYLRYPQSPVRLRLAQHSPEEVALCTIVKAELYYGAYRSADPQANLQLLAQFFQPFVCLAYDDRSAEIYGSIRAALASQGLMIGPHDLLIASIAVAHRLILVTSNWREFQRIAGLSWEDWTQ